jgi:hypothetical protein
VSDQDSGGKVWQRYTDYLEQNRSRPLKVIENKTQRHERGDLDMRRNLTEWRHVGKGRWLLSITGLRCLALYALQAAGHVVNPLNRQPVQEILTDV